MSMEELTEELVVARNNHGLLHPGGPFPGRVVVSCDPTVEAARLADVLSTASHAGYHEMDFRLTTIETIQRPLLGRISRLKTTAARASFGWQAVGTEVPLRGEAGPTCGEVVRQVIKLRRAGQKVRFSVTGE